MKQKQHGTAQIKSALCRTALSLGLLFPLGATTVTAAENIASAYTRLQLDKCRHTQSNEPEDYGFWICPGHAGISVRIGGADQRITVSFGPEADKQLAAEQTFPSFNSVDKVNVEWRTASAEGGAAKPFATIVRWTVKTEKDSKRSSGRVLVVTTLGPAVCHVGYVDALANKDANVLARKLANERARTFDCGKDIRLIYGRKGPSVAGMAQQLEDQAAEKR